MAAKNKKPARFNLQDAFAAHVEATGRAREWVARCLEHRTEGDVGKAKAAEQKARHWLRKTLVLEAKAATGKPTGGRNVDSTS